MPYLRDLSAAIRRYVVPDQRYLKLLHGNVLSLAEPQRTAFLNALVRDAHTADDAELTVMLSTSSGWRERLTAAWMVGMDARAQFRDRIGELLLASTQVYAGQGYCLALACLGTELDAELLCAYLDKYLRRPDLYYDQTWAMSALLHLDTTLGTDHAERFLAPDGLWHRWSEAHPRTSLDRRSQHFAAVVVLRDKFAPASTTAAGTTVRRDQLPDGWFVMAADQMARFDAELSREVRQEHILAGVATTAIARCEGCDDVLFRLDEDPIRWAIVHLTWSREIEPGSFPSWRLFASIETAMASLTEHITDARPTELGRRKAPPHERITPDRRNSAPMILKVSR